MGYRHAREDLLAAAQELVAADGLTGLSFGRLAKRLGIADRTIVYYFPTKRELVTEVLVSYGLRLQAILDDAIGPQPAPADELLARSWSVFTTAAADEVTAVYVEAIGLAAGGVEPYDSVVPSIIEAWTDWLGARIVVDASEDRRAVCLGVLARVDGLLVLRHTAGHEAADLAARALGIAAR